MFEKNILDMEMLKKNYKILLRVNFKTLRNLSFMQKSQYLRMIS